MDWRAFRRAVSAAACVVLAAVPMALAQAGGGGNGGGTAGGGGPGGGGVGAGGAGTGASGATGASAPPKPALTNVPSTNDPLEPYFAWKQRIYEQYGFKAGLNIDLTSQTVITGPSSPFTRPVARYDLGLHQKLWEGAEADMDVRGGWGDGPDAEYNNTVNTNQYARTGSRIFVLHLWLQQKLMDDQLTFRAGKMDVGDFMDVNRFGYYNFVGYSFAHNFAIPLPGNPLAAMFTYEPKWGNGWYLSGAVANNYNAGPSSYRAGFDDLFAGNTSLFALAELGWKTKFFGQDGIYRFEAFYDGRDLTHIDGVGNDNQRGGFAISFDQNITKDFGVFVRYGWANQHEYTPMQYWSAGFDWTAPFGDARPKDDFAIGVVQNVFSSMRDQVVSNASNEETYFEAYYNFYVTQWLQVQPMVQIVTNPGGVAATTETVLGAHVAFRF